MGLVELLKNPDAIPIGIDGNQKEIKNHYFSNSFYHLNRIEGWDPDTQDPILIGEDHKNGTTPDYLFRGGLNVHQDRVKTDVKRIQAFLDNDIGGEFKLRQGALQLLNPQSNTRTFNRGASLIAQIMASGISRFKRHGLVPEPASVNLNAQFGTDLGEGISNSGFLEKIGFSDDARSTMGDFVSDVIGGTYVSLIGKDKLRENNYGLGDVGANTSKNIFDHILGDINPLKSKPSYNAYTVDSNLSKIDKINYQTVYTVKDTKATPAIEEKFISKDFIDFKFEVMHSDRNNEHDVIVFRAFLDSFTDNYTAAHNEIKYNGRGESFYTYNKFNRAVNIGFKIAAQTRHEMKPLYQKLNYLVAQTAPNYSRSTGRMRTPYMRLTMGDYFNRLPGVLKSANISWAVTYPWEIKLDPKNKDKDMKVLPQILNVTISFQPIHDFVPNNGLDAPFIGIHKEGDSWLIEEPSNHLESGEIDLKEEKKEIKNTEEKIIKKENEKTGGDNGNSNNNNSPGSNDSRPIVGGYPDFTSEGSFSAAWRAAYNELGTGKTFMWNGGSYTTDREDGVENIIN
tara:strand:+ start:457 stop:2157 length:1701 start_codon:yes stop_codon:yes gene_type:complete